MGIQSYPCVAPVLSALVALSACAVGPNTQLPKLSPTGYTREALPSQTESAPGAGATAEAQRFAMGRDLPGEWWTLFGSPRLNDWIVQAMRRYPDIDAQQAALRAARENVRAQRALLLPWLSGAAQGSRERISGAAIAPGFPSFITNIFQANVNVSYTLDLFGGERRAIEELQAQAEAQQFQLEASYLTLTSNVAATAIQIASVHDQIEATHELLALEGRQLNFIERQFDLGSRSRADVLQQQSNLAALRTTLPPLQQALEAAEHQLALLIGRFPQELADVEFPLSELKLPQELPVSLPSELTAQRPDIRVHGALVRQASAAVGVATANMLPQLTLSGSVGDESLQLANLLQPGSSVWSLAFGVAQPLFEGGALRAKRRAALDTYAEVRAQYQLTVLQAFQNVADSLTALNNDAQALRAELDSVDAAKASLDLLQRQYDDGAVNYVSLLTAQQTYQQARIALVRAQASRLADTVALFQALGGGWWNRRDAGTLAREVPSSERSSAP